VSPSCIRDGRAPASSSPAPRPPSWVRRRPSGSAALERRAGAPGRAQPPGPRAARLGGPRAEHRQRPGRRRRARARHRPEFARTALAAIAESARAGRADLDHVLGLLRDDDAPGGGPRAPVPTLEALDGLLSRIRSTGSSSTRGSPAGWAASPDRSRRRPTASCRRA
jgi:hypothetical protein